MDPECNLQPALDRIEHEEAVLQSAMDRECNLQPTFGPHGAKRISCVSTDGTMVQSVVYLCREVIAEAQHSVQSTMVADCAWHLAYEQYD